jgi:hypothetical protein
MGGFVFWLSTGKKTMNRTSLYYIYLLLLSPLPAALTLEDSPNVHRSLLFGVLLMISLGKLAEKVVVSHYPRKRIFLVLLLCVFLFEIGHFWDQYAVHSIETQALARNSDTNTLATFLVANAPDYDAVYAPWQSKLPIHYLFQKGVFTRTLAGQFSRDLEISRIDNLYFDWERCPSGMTLVKDSPLRLLVVDDVMCPLPEYMTVMTIIKRADGYDAYRVLAR